MPDEEGKGDGMTHTRTDARVIGHRSRPHLLLERLGRGIEMGRWSPCGLQSYIEAMELVIDANTPVVQVARPHVDCINRIERIPGTRDPFVWLPSICFSLRVRVRQGRTGVTGVAGNSVALYGELIDIFAALDSALGLS